MARYITPVRSDIIPSTGPSNVRTICSQALSPPNYSSWPEDCAVMWGVLNTCTPCSTGGEESCSHPHHSHLLPQNTLSLLLGYSSSFQEDRSWNRTSCLSL